MDKQQSETSTNNTINAASILLNLGFELNKSTGSYSYNGDDKSTNDIHTELNDSCVYFQTLCDQDTWTISDGSYITRALDEEYYIGEDITDFELVAIESVLDEEYYN